MTVQEIIFKLKNDFPFLVSVIVNNNPDAVIRNLSQVYDKDFENLMAVEKIILQFKEIGQDKIVRTILAVPFLTSNANQNLQKAWLQIEDQARTLRLTQGRVGDPGETPMSTLGGETGETGDTGGGFGSWSGGMFDAIGQIGSSYFNSQGGQVQPGGSGGYGFAGIGDNSGGSNTSMYVVIGLIVAVIIVVVVIAMRRRGGKN